MAIDITRFLVDDETLKVLRRSPMEESLIRAVSLAKAAEPAPKKPKTKTYNLTVEQIEAMKKKAVDEALEMAWELTLCIPTMALHDVFGFGEKRLDRFLEKVLYLYDSFAAGYFTLEDARKMLHEESGYSIQKVKERRKYK